MLLQSTPNPFNGIVLAVIGRIIGEFHVDLIVVCQASQAIHQLRTAAMHFRAIVCVNEQGSDLRELRTISQKDARQSAVKSLVRRELVM